MRAAVTDNHRIHVFFTTKTTREADILPADDFQDTDIFLSLVHFCCVNRFTHNEPHNNNNDNNKEPVHFLRFTFFVTAFIPL